MKKNHLKLVKSDPAVVQFHCEKSEYDLIAKIASRAENMFGKQIHRQTLVMDLSACHSNGCPLDFQKLLDFDAFNFSHDIVGIDRHISRKTGKLKDCFVPRCAR